MRDAQAMQAPLGLNPPAHHGAFLSATDQLTGAMGHEASRTRQKMDRLKQARLARRIRPVKDIEPGCGRQRSRAQMADALPAKVDEAIRFR
jgi:hypothetical protein